jgi:shikimate kinase
MIPELTTIRQSIALIGLSGTGKSTVAALLAARLGWQRVDTDAMIVERTGRTPSELFVTEGETVFRALETAVLREVLTQSRRAFAHHSVIATGGGIVLREENRILLRTYTHVVWMDAPTDILLARLLAHHEERPLVSGRNPAGRIDTLRSARVHIYQALADQVINTAKMTPEEVATSILNEA